MKGEQQVETALKSYEDVDSWKTVIFLYNAALKEVGTKLEILNEEFQHVHKYNPIEHIKTRIKTPESIVKKLKRYGYETSIENMVRYVNDIAGVRVICSFTSDIYRLAERKSERPEGALHQGLYQESEGERIQKLPHACVCADLSVGQCGRYKG